MHTLRPISELVSRFYRAPEIIIGHPFDYGIDMWAMGCIMGEMLCGKAVFPGQSTMNQLEKIVELTGMPTEADLEAIGSSYAGTMLQSMSVPESMGGQLWRERFPNASDDVRASHRPPAPPEQHTPAPPPAREPSRPPRTGARPHAEAAQVQPRRAAHFRSGRTAPFHLC